MKFRAACLSALMFLAAPAAAMAGPVADAGQRAEALAAEGKVLEALQALDQAVDAIWVQSPLLFRNVGLVMAEDQGSAPRTDRVYRPDELFRVRVEPVGYGYGPGNAGQAKVGFNADLTIENATGQVLAEAKDVFEVSVDTSPHNRHFDMTLSFAVPYVRPGEYTARFNVRDQNSPKTGTFDVPFTVAAPVAADAGQPAPAEAGGSAAPPPAAQ